MENAGEARRHHRRRALVVAGILAWTGGWAAAAPGERPLDELLEEVRVARDDVDPGVFDEMGAHRDLDGFRTLQQAVDLVADPQLWDRAFAQFRAFGGTDLEAGVIAWLDGRVGGSTNSRLRQAATRALCSFGGDALDEMRAILEGSHDQACRRIAIGGLVPMIQAQRTPEALTSFLTWYRVGISGSRETGLRTIGVFRSRESLDLLEGFLSDKATPAQTKALVVGALGTMGGGRALDLVEDALRARHPTVSLAAIRALSEAGHTGHEAALKRLERSREAAVRREAIIARSTFAAGEAWVEHVEKARVSRDYALRMGAAVALERLGTPAALEALQGMLADPSHLVRGEVIECIGRLRGLDAVALLAGALEGETLRSRLRICELLEDLTGLTLGDSPERWRRWWAAEGAEFVLPTAEQLAEARAERAHRRSRSNRTAAAFYGINIDSDRLCFVLDVSGSMGGSRLSLLKEEMSRTLERMSDGGQFNLIFFADQISKWKGKLVELDAASRASAQRRLRSLHAGGGTALFNGLAEALEDVEVDTIILLSDGMPSAGRIQGSEQILDEIERRNALRHVVIHGVSLGGGSALLRRLAEATGGVYREVG
ncbi:MAG: hypothetical protein CMJ84_18725 [Planctomycetes bacterium]|jgi:Mg-chelatase subunit ChlD|nr:hypothetical protein [Planctomycetota bacterium]MDP6409747.1 HEAT repeat domain-containing protein [Planctomycetota bacterium]